MNAKILARRAFLAIVICAVGTPLFFAGHFLTRHPFSRGWPDAAGAKVGEERMVEFPALRNSLVTSLSPDHHPSRVRLSKPSGSDSKPGCLAVASIGFPAVTERSSAQRHLFGRFLGIRLRPQVSSQTIPKSSASPTEFEHKKPRFALPPQKVGTNAGHLSGPRVVRENSGSPRGRVVGVSPLNGILGIRPSPPPDKLEQASAPVQLNRPIAYVVEERSPREGLETRPVNAARASDEDEYLLPPGTDDWLFENDSDRQATPAESTRREAANESPSYAEAPSSGAAPAVAGPAAADLPAVPRFEINSPTRQDSSAFEESRIAQPQQLEPQSRADLPAALAHDELAKDDAASSPLEVDVGTYSTVDQVANLIGRGRLAEGLNPIQLGLADVVMLTLQHSKSISVSRILPAEELQEVNREFGKFDWQSFVNSSWQQNAQPVGSVAQTNLGLAQVRNDDNSVQFGIRKPTLLGGEIELSETLGTRDSNSGLLDPVEQGNAQMRITFAQELLRDGGRDVVLSNALIASYLADQVHAEAFADVSEVLQAVLVQYWDLYQKRGNYFIQLSLIRWAEEALSILESRGRIDAQRNSIEQARALLLEARAELRNAKTEVLISQDELYRLVNAPEIDSNQVELLPIEPPRMSGRQYGLPEEFQEALVHRSEIAQKLIEIQAAAVEHHVSLNQLLPRLTFSIESSLNSLDEDKDFWGAKANLADIDPSYQANVNFEIFLGNRVARAANKQAQLALKRLQFEYEDQIEQVRLDVAKAIRELNGSTSILEQRRKTLTARQEEIEYLRLRRDVIPQQGASPSLLLEQFFQAITRLVASQQAYIDAIATQQSAFADLLRAKGVLLQASEVPRDLGIRVPSLRRAARNQAAAKSLHRNSAIHRVVAPGNRRNLPPYR